MEHFFYDSSEPYNSFIFRKEVRSPDILTTSSLTVENKPVNLPSIKHSLCHYFVDSRHDFESYSFYGVGHKSLTVLQALLEINLNALYNFLMERL